MTDPKVKFKDIYVLKELVDLWRQDGHEVVIGYTDRLEADIGILHIDQTWVKDGYVPEISDNIRLLNGAVRDISKRSFSEQILDVNSQYDGQVLVKTNANCHGYQDIQARTNPKRGYSYIQYKIKRKLLNFIKSRSLNEYSWRYLHYIPEDYPILDNISNVPNCVWKRNDLIVEKFLPEKEGDLYILRLWLFFGDRECSVKIWGRKPIVKSRDLVRYEYIDEVPEVLRKARKKLGFDFGKFDYIMRNGEAILLDVNKTPTFSPSEHDVNPISIRLAQGIHSYF